MDRSHLGGFGATLSEWELAQALAAQGVLSKGAFVFGMKPVERLVSQLATGAPDGLCEVETWWIPTHIRIDEDPAPSMAEAWRSFILQHPNLNLRLEVNANHSSSAIGVGNWVARMCCHPKVGAESVYLRLLTGETDRPVSWEWPLRLGVLGSAGSSPQHADLFDALAKVPLDNLWSVVDMTQPGAECELLLLPGDLRQGLASILQAPQRPRADCALVLSGSQLSDARNEALKAALLEEAQASGVAVIPAGNAIDQLLSALIPELARSRPLDVALFNAVAQTRPSLVSPLRPDLLFSRTLAMSSTARLSAARLFHHFSSIPTNLRLGRTGLPSEVPIEFGPSAATGLSPVDWKQPDPVMDSVVRSLRKSVEEGNWEHETEDATALVKARDIIARSTGQRHHSARITSGSVEAIPPQPTEEVDSREVAVQVEDLAENKVVRYLRSDRAYRLLVKVALPGDGFIAAGEALPALPPSSTGHLLDITLVVLSSDMDGGRPSPQQQQIFLPPTGESTRAEFSFTTHGIQKSFQARLLVSYQNRILQTLRLDGELGDDASEKLYQFGVENLVQPGFHNLAYQEPFDAALVVNHSATGQPGITMIAGSSACFLEPSGMGEMVEALKSTLTNNTALGDEAAVSSLDSDFTTDLIYGVMQHGRILYDYIEPYLGSLDMGAGRIQVVETRPGAYFPVEFLYPMRVPRKKPPLCDQARNALIGEASHEECPHRDDPNHLCPMRFWGIRKQIERQPDGVVPKASELTNIIVPTPTSGRLDMFRSV